MSSSDESDVVELPQHDEDKLIALSYAIREYFTRDDPKGERFYERPDDCYDGICMDSKDLFDYMNSVIASGDEVYANFIKNPFEGDIMKFLKRGASCGNSSCLYLIPYNAHLETKYPTVEFLNKIFGIICE
jgi:hypothetical protein